MIATPLRLRTAAVSRLLAGPDLSWGAERLDHHLERLGRLPDGGDLLIGALEASGLQGRGGAGFPTFRKWASVADGSRGRSTVVVNASEGEPLSAKDRTLMSLRPHLVLDGAALAAAAVGASEIIVYLSRGSPTTEHAVARALKDRRQARLQEPPIRIVSTSHRYIAGESSAVVRRISGGQAKPQFTPPHPSERGLDGQPTLVQNAETLAHVALIARRGAGWFRQFGTHGSPGTTLMTLAGNVARPGVYEIDLAADLSGVLDAAAGTLSPPAGALLGGYFGTWLSAESLIDLPLDAEQLRRAGASIGCGVLAVLPEHSCGIIEAARIAHYLAGESAGQCGPCVHGLRAIADTMERLATSSAAPADVDRLRRWAGLVRGRGACRHPDGAVGQLGSALSVFADHMQFHLTGRRCPGRQAPGFPAPPRAARGWR